MGKIFDFFIQFSLLVSELREFIEILHEINDNLHQYEEAFKQKNEADQSYQARICLMLSQMQDRLK